MASTTVPTVVLSAKWVAVGAECANKVVAEWSLKCQGVVGGKVTTGLL